MASRGALVASVMRDSAHWSLCSAAVTAAACGALRAWTHRWFFAHNIGACVLWFVVMLQRLFILLPAHTPQWSAAELMLPVAQLGLRIAALRSARRTQHRVRVEFLAGRLLLAF